MSNPAAKYGQPDHAPHDLSVALQPPHKAGPEPGSRPPPPRIKHGHIRFGNREIATPLLLTVMLETALLAAVGLLAPSIRFSEWPSITMLPTQTSPLNIAAFVLVTLLALVSVGFYRHGLRLRFNDLILHLVGAFILSSIGLGFLYYLYPDMILGRGILLIAYALALPVLLLFRLIVVPLLDHAVFARRVLVLGAGELATLIDQLRHKMDPHDFTIAGFVYWVKEPVKVAPEETIVLNGSLHDYARANRIDDIVIALDNQRGTLPITDLVHCKMEGVQVLDVTDFLEREAGLLKLDSLRPSTLVFSKSFRQSFYRSVVKRVIDLVAGLVLLIVTFPLMIATALGILIESRGRGSILFTQTRVGEHGRTFTLYKFRSMVMDAEKDGAARWAAENDPRVTPFGTFIRKTRLDELPQLVNVLKGDMSFVGPRPERPEFVKILGEQLPYYEWRHWVKPGLTGWAQINYPYGSTVEDAFEKLQYDLYYVKHQNSVLDILTIMQTVEVVLWERGSR